jgi:hypothetical protein
MVPQVSLEKSPLIRLSFAHTSTSLKQLANFPLCPL